MLNSFTGSSGEVSKSGPNEGSVCVCVQARTCYHFSRVRLCDCMDCSLPGSSVHGILQSRILEWIAMPSSRGSSQPRDWTHVSKVSCIGRQFFATKPIGEPPKLRLHENNKDGRAYVWNTILPRSSSHLVQQNYEGWHPPRYCKKD